MNQKKLLLIGIDGATWRIIDPLIDKGRLPTLEKLRAEGAAGPLESTVIPNTPPAWISFMTGKHPGKTGIYDFLRREPGQYALKVCTSIDNDEPTLFRILSRAGRRVCSINMPMTYPPEKLNGVMVSGIPLPPDARDFCYPQELLAEIENEVGGYIVDVDYSKFSAHLADPADAFELYDKLLSELYDALERRQRAVLYLLEKEKPDLFSVVYSIVDRVQHYFWKFISSSHPGYSDEGAGRFKTVIEDAYEELDRKIGQLLEAAPDYHVVLMSDHVFGPYIRDVHLNRWLIEKGYLVLKKTPRITARRTTIGNLFSKFGLRKFSSFLPTGLREYPLPRPFIKRIPDEDDIIWSRTKAYSNLYGVSVNLKGREPEGIVAEGDEYRTLTSQIIRDLEGLRDDRTGEKLVDRADVKENLFQGQNVSLAADVYFMISGLSYHITKRLDVDHIFDDRTFFGMSGTHRMDGIVLIRVGGVKPGMRIEKASIMDIPATVLYIMDHPVLENMDGKVLVEIFEDNLLSEHPIRTTGEDALHLSRDDAGYTKEEEEDILNLLKGLGYLG